MIANCPLIVGFILISNSTTFLAASRSFPKLFDNTLQQFVKKQLVAVDDSISIKPFQEIAVDVLSNDCDSDRNSLRIISISEQDPIKKKTKGVKQRISSMGCQAQISESKLKILLSCSDSYSYGRKLFYTIADERGCTNSARLLIKKVSKRRIKPKPKIQLVNVRDRKLFKSWLSRTYGGDAEDIANSLFGTLDGGYYVASLTASINGDIGSNSGKKDAWLIKLNNKGDIDYKQTNAKDFWVLKFNETNQSQEFI